MQAEALVKLSRHDEADAVLGGAPRFGVDESTKFFGTVAHAYVLMIRAQVDMAAGRFVLNVVFYFFSSSSIKWRSAEMRWLYSDAVVFMLDV